MFAGSKLRKRNGAGIRPPKFDIHAALDKALIEPLRCALESRQSPVQRRQNRRAHIVVVVVVVVQRNFRTSRVESFD